MSTVHIYISGFVQGVGYRAFVKKHAQELGLTGWVKNLPDRRVEALFQGDKKRIEQMLVLCKKGSFLAEVEGVNVLWGDVEDDRFGFEILRD